MSLFTVFVGLGFLVAASAFVYRLIKTGDLEKGLINGFNSCVVYLAVVAMITVASWLISELAGDTLTSILTILSLILGGGIALFGAGFYLGRRTAPHGKAKRLASHLAMPLEDDDVMST